MWATLIYNIMLIFACPTGTVLWSVQRLTVPCLVFHLNWLIKCRCCCLCSSSFGSTSVESHRDAHIHCKQDDEDEDDNLSHFLLSEHTHTTSIQVNTLYIYIRTSAHSSFMNILFVSCLTSLSLSVLHFLYLHLLPPLFLSVSFSSLTLLHPPHFSLPSHNLILLSLSALILPPFISYHLSSLAVFLADKWVTIFYTYIFSLFLLHVCA